MGSRKVKSYSFVMNPRYNVVEDYNLVNTHSSSIPHFYNNQGHPLNRIDIESMNMITDLDKAQEAGKYSFRSIDFRNGCTKRKLEELAKDSIGESSSTSQRSKKNELMRCKECNVLVWSAESTSKDCVTKSLLFSICCKQGRVQLPKLKEPPLILKDLLRELSFRNNIRVYNYMLSMCSMGAEIDYSILNSRGPYCFKVHGENFHSIGSLLPKDGEKPKFLQMYIYDTSNEVKNRISSIYKGGKNEVSETILSSLIEMLDENNVLAQIFRKARDRYEDNPKLELSIHLIGYDKRKRQYELPTANEIAGLVVGDLQEQLEKEMFYYNINLEIYKEL